jgi:hypothetical protein
MGGRGRYTGYANYFRDYKRLGPIAKLATSYAEVEASIQRYNEREQRGKTYE